MRNEVHLMVFSGSALVLNEKEYQAFQEQYLKVKGLTKKDVIAKLLGFDDTSYEIEPEYIDANCMDAFQERGYEKSVFTNENFTSPEQDRFFIQVCNHARDCDGMEFTPYYHNGEPNILKEVKYTLPEGGDIISKEYFSKYLANETSYVAFSDRRMDDVAAFFDRPYASYEEFVQEFKDKFQRYLPEDFNWDEHLGIFSYAFYRCPW